MNNKYRVQEGQVYRRTDDEISNEAIDNYLQESVYKDWEELSIEDREKVLSLMWEEEQQYEKAIRNDWVE